MPLIPSSWTSQGRQAAHVRAVAARGDWPTGAQLITACAPLLPEGAQPALWLKELADMSDRVLEKRHNASFKATSAHWFARGAGGASAAVATLSGGTLIGKNAGSTGQLIGLITAVVGLVAAGIVAANPGASYAADLQRKALYEQLWWDMRGFAMTELPTATPDSYSSARAAFAQREASIMAALPAAQGATGGG